MSITLLPTPPSRSDDPDTFIARADAFVAALNQFVAEVNATATAFATTKWVSGTSYTQGDVVWSPADMNTYRRLITGGGTTDPSVDATNWLLIVAFGGAAGVAGSNFIINGAMEIDQRNSGSAITPTSSVYSTDRWHTELTQASKLTFQQVADAPPGFKKSLKITVASQFSAGSTDAFEVFQGIEGLNCISLGLGTAGAVQVTMSFYAKASVAGNYSMFLQNSAQNRSYCFTQALTTSWARCSKTLTLDTTGTWLTDTGLGLRVGFDLGSGSTLQGTANVWNGSSQYAVTGAVQFVNQVNGSTLNITGVKLESRSSMTMYEHRPYGLELALCRRYFNIITGLSSTTQWGLGQVASGTGVGMMINGEMRTSPAVAISGFSITDIGSTSAITVVNSALQSGGETVLNLACGGASFTAGRACMFYANASSDYITLNADF